MSISLNMGLMHLPRRQGYIVQGFQDVYTHIYHSSHMVYSATKQWPAFYMTSMQYFDKFFM